jgi:hypothetical protein
VYLNESLTRGYAVETLGPEALLRDNMEYSMQLRLLGDYYVLV